jgi:NADH-quinone oxidoreductase subunit D
VIVSIGPSHPATHGTLQIFAELERRARARADVHCGYLHRGFEKECESHNWHNLIPYVDRLNYCSALINDFAYCDAVETLMGIEITPRTRYLRTLLSEYSRIADHLTCIAASLMELGAMTAFLYLMTIRDYIYEHLADLTGARVTHSYGRIGGLAHDLPEGWIKRLEEILDEYETYVGRVHGLLDRNRIFIDRTRNVGVLSTADAIHWGFTGPVLRSTGAPRDLRKDTPYLAYAELDFEVPVGINGDNYDRYYVRMREMDESVYMIRQLIELLPEGRSTSTTAAAPSRTSRWSTRDRVADQPLQAGDGRPAGAGRRDLPGPRGAQRRARLLPGEHGSGTPWRVHVRAPELRAHGRAAQAARGLPARRPHPDLRHHQHDRRGVRPVKHLIPEFEAEEAPAAGPGFGTLLLPCLHRIQEDRGYIADEDIQGWSTTSACRASRWTKCCPSTACSAARPSAAATSRCAATSPAPCAAPSG